ncbi:hypothetical protein M1293_03525 [Candidatus Parvarchaeota archaeon]|nr:hypothetical protein [Candidatus Parvarchaeota archaeon]
MLPEPGDCNFIKKSTIRYGDKTEKVLIYRLKGSPDFHISFKCPSCTIEKEIIGELNIRKYKEGGKKKEGYEFVCDSCNTVFCIERLKPGRGASSK